MAFNNSAGRMRRRVANTKGAKKSNARTYSDGFMSMTQLATACGLKGYGSGNKVKWALIRGGYAKLENSLTVPTEKGKDVSRFYSEVDPKNPDRDNQWYIWNSSLVEEVKFLIEDYEKHPEKYKDVSSALREDVGSKYPDGFTTALTMAEILNCHVTVFRDFLIRRKFAAWDNNSVRPNYKIRGYEMFGIDFEFTGNGKEEKWSLWNEKLIPIFRKYLDENPDIDPKQPRPVAKEADPAPTTMDADE